MSEKTDELEKLPPGITHKGYTWRVYHIPMADRHWHIIMVKNMRDLSATYGYGRGPSLTVIDSLIF